MTLRAQLREQLAAATAASEPYLSPEDAGRLLHHSPEWARSNAGELGAVKVGGRLLFPARGNRRLYAGAPGGRKGRARRAPHPIAPGTAPGAERRAGAAGHRARRDRVVAPFCEAQDCPGRHKVYIYIENRRQSRLRALGAVQLRR